MNNNSKLIVRVNDRLSDHDSIVVKRKKSEEHSNLIELNDRLKIAQEYDLSIDFTQFEKNDISLEIECEIDEIAFVMIEEFFNQDFKKIVELEGKNKDLHLRKLPFYLFESKKSSNEQKIRLQILSADTYKQRLLEWISYQKKKFTDFNNKFVNMKVFVLKILRLKSEIDNPILSSVIEEDGEIKLQPVKQNDIDPTRDIAVFVHGLGSVVGNNFKGLYQELKNDFNILAFSYPTVNKSITDNSYSLKLMLDNYKDFNIHIFSHSMGGLVSRNALREHNAHIHSVIMAGTPNNGAKAAGFAKSLNVVKGRKFEFNKKIFKDLYFFLAMSEGFRTGYWNLTDLLDFVNTETPGIDQLMSQSNFIKRLNDKEIKARKYNMYYTLAGNPRKWFGDEHDTIVATTNVSRIISNQETRQLIGIIHPWKHSEYYSEDKVEYLKKAIGDAKGFLGIPISK
jgi:pimeloyl-ACP methyl ester carboxylesterase